MKRFLIGVCLTGMTACGMQVVGDTKDSQAGTYSDFEDASNEEDEQAEDSIDSSTEEDEESDEIESEEEAEDSSAPADEEPETLTDYLLAGPYDTISQSSIASVTDCSSMSYSIYSPVGVADPPVVVLGHGFARGSSVMIGWAEHLSTWGIEVLLPTLCHYNIFFGVDHEMNGQNMKELSDIHGSTGTVYAGHSAGGLAAIIAASQDESAIGVLGLDATDTQDTPGVSDFIGREYAGSVTSPAFSITGEPSSCNANNNGLDLFRMMDDYRAIKVSSSDHCDFENPTDSVCEISCENSSVVFGDEEIRSAITALGTSAIVSLSGISGEDSLSWTPEEMSGWISSGLVQELE